ncbi:MAG: acyl-CoA dehydrogenase domain-containing protein [Pseudomonadota bacterium]
MFWLLVFLIAAVVLAYRGAPLTTATGVVGVTVLFYGWLGGSLGVFALLLIAMLLLFVPLNVAAVRQEWLTLPLLNRFLTLTPPASIEGERGPGAALVAGDWAATFPLLEKPADPQADIRLEAFGAALSHRLMHPLELPTPNGAQARIVEGLMIGTALHRVGLRLIAGRPTRVPAREAWRLARHGATLLGHGSAPRVEDVEAEDNARLLSILAAVHPYYPQWLAAANDEHAAHRLLTFDRAVWGAFGHALQNAARALVGGLTGAMLIPAEGDDDLKPLQRQVRLAQSRFAVATDLLLALPLMSVQAPGLAPRLAAALEALQAMLGLLAWHRTAPLPQTERVVVTNALHRSLAAFEEALWVALQELPHAGLRVGITLICLPLGRRARVPTVAEEASAATALLCEPALRKRLRTGIATHPALDELEARIETLRRLEPTLRQLQQAQFEPPPADDRARLAAAARLHLVDDEETATLSQALDFAETLKAASRSGGEAIHPEGSSAHG